MAMADQADPRKGDGHGFEGEIAGFGLSDILQLNAQNRFSGCIEVLYQDRRGLLFFRDGEIVHAEDGSTAGEQAFYEILAWPGGRFAIQENVATTRMTIQKGCNFLLLEAHRLIDERRAGRGAALPLATPMPAKPAPAAPASAAAPPQSSGARTATATALLQSLRRIPGVVDAVLQTKDGARVGDDSGYGAEVLAGQFLYLELMARQLGEDLRSGELQSAIVQGTEHHLLCFVARHHFLTVLAKASAPVGAVEAEVRKLLAPAR